MVPLSPSAWRSCIHVSVCKTGMIVLLKMRRISGIFIVILSMNSISVFKGWLVCRERNLWGWGEQEDLHPFLLSQIHPAAKALRD